MITTTPQKQLLLPRLHIQGGSSAVGEGPVSTAEVQGHRATEELVEERR